MLEKTTHTIGDEELCESFVECGGLFESITSSFPENDYLQNIIGDNGSFPEMEEEEIVVPQRRNPLQQINTKNDKPILTDSVVVEDLNKCDSK